MIVGIILEYQKKALESAYTKLIWNGIKTCMPILESGPIMYLFKKTLMYSLVALQKYTSTFNRLVVHPQSWQRKALVIGASLLAVLTPTLKIRRCNLDHLRRKPEPRQCCPVVKRKNRFLRHWLHWS